MPNNSIAPLFSVIIPTYNCAAMIGATIDSVLAQTFRDFEIIVVDDGSTDLTPAALQSYEDKIQSIRQSNQGAEAARHNGAKHARGDYLVLLDHDDLLLPEALSIYAAVIRSDDTPTLIIAQLCRFHDGEPMPVQPHFSEAIEVLHYPDYYSRDRSLAETCSQLIINRSVAEATNALRPKLTAFPYDSCDILLAIGSCSPCIAIQRPTTVAYRYHAANSSGDLEYMVKMAPRLLNLTRRNEYCMPVCERCSKGMACPRNPVVGVDHKKTKPRHFARYANLGGIQFAYLNRCLKARRADLARKVIQDSWLMLLAAIARKFSLRLRGRVTPLILSPFGPDGQTRSSAI